jgi:hypothetical protein
MGPGWRITFTIERNFTTTPPIRGVETSNLSEVSGEIENPIKRLIKLL